MSRGRKTKRGRPPFCCPRSLVSARPFIRGRWLPGLVLALLPVACTHPSGFRDPLNGDNPPIPAKPAASTLPSAVATSPSGETPKKTDAAPVSSSAGPSPASLTIGHPGAETEHPVEPPTPTLHPPEPNDSAHGSHIVPISTTSGESYEDLQTQLKTLGVTDQSLRRSPNSDTWTFFCQIPTKGSPNILKSYEAQASGDNGLNAIRAVLGKIKLSQP